MNKILVFDFETSGLPDYNKRARDPSQPHIVQYAGVLYDANTRHIIDEYNQIARPDGWQITAELAAIHGISHAQACKVGIPESVIARKFWDMAQSADLTVAHNHSFDKFIGRIAARRFGIMTDADDEAWKIKNSLCTMKVTTNICRIPSPRGFGFKWPKLAEAYAHFFGKPLVNAHNALYDLRACADIYFHLKDNGLIPATV